MVLSSKHSWRSLQQALKVVFGQERKDKLLATALNVECAQAALAVSGPAWGSSPTSREGQGPRGLGVRARTASSLLEKRDKRQSEPPHLPSLRRLEVGGRALWPTGLCEVRKLREKGQFQGQGSMVFPRLLTPFPRTVILRLLR